RAFSTQRFPRGNYREDAIYFSEMNSDFLLTYSKTDNPNWSYTISLGGNQMRQQNRYSQTVAPELLIPEIYNFTNTAVNLQVTQNKSEKWITLFMGMRNWVTRTCYSWILPGEMTGQAHFL